MTQNIEIDIANNVVVFRLTGEGIAPGTYAVLDYTKVGLYALYIDYDLSLGMTHFLLSCFNFDKFQLNSFRDIL